jgi:ribosomal protein S18 acetylase RimI-like enzyme
MALERLALREADAADLPAVVELVNRAYRGETSRAGWTNEAEYIDGERTSLEALAAEAAQSPLGALLLAETSQGLVGCVRIDPAGEGAWYLGMLTISPGLQAAGLGRRLLEAAEAAAQARGARRVRMTVVNIREGLIGWYERRGYRRTGELQPFPYDDARFGVPRRPDLAFAVLERELR